MAAKIIQSTDPINVKVISALVYGQPGSRKTSLAQTTEEPVSLCFDEGIYRAYGRKTAVLFDEWGDVVNFDVKPYRTVVIDTISKCLEKLGVAIINDNPKNGNRLGGLSLQGYGVLKTMFGSWVSRLREAQKTIIFIAQEKSERIGDNNYYFPDIVGSNYAIVMDNADVAAYLHFENNRRVLDFNPSDSWMAKTPPGWGPYAEKFMTNRSGQLALPDFGQEPQFFSTLLHEARSSMGKISAESAAVAAAVNDWQEWLNISPDLEEVNKRLENFKILEEAVKKQVWFLITNYCAGKGLVFDKASKQFKEKEAA